MWEQHKTKQDPSGKCYKANKMEDQNNNNKKDHSPTSNILGWQLKLILTIIKRILSVKGWKPTEKNEEHNKKTNMVKVTNIKTKVQKKMIPKKRQKYKIEWYRKKTKRRIKR